MFLTVQDVAKMLQLSELKVRSLARRKDLPGVKIGGVWRFNPKLLERFLDEGTV